MITKSRLSKLVSAVERIAETLLAAVKHGFSVLRKNLFPQKGEEKARRLDGVSMDEKEKEQKEETPQPASLVQSMQIAYTSNVGRIRELDEDSIVVLDYSDSHKSSNSRKILAIMADGMGGHSQGEVASSLATKAISQSVFPLFHKEGTLEEEYLATLQESILRANIDIMKHALNHPECTNMGTTASAVIVDSENLYIGHVGDTRVYILKRDSINQLTKDHSYVQMLVDRGEITPEEARNHPRKNEITRAIGVGSKLEADVFSEALEDDDYVLICCDGLVNEVEDEEILHLVFGSESMQNACDELVNLANERGGRDNISVIIIGPITIPEPSESTCLEIEEKTAPSQPMPLPHTPLPPEPSAVSETTSYESWCTECGQPITTAKAEKCPNCGEELEDEGDSGQSQTNREHLPS